MILHWCVIFALVTWQASGQAPDDHNPDCRTGMNEIRHIFPPEWEVLMDTFDYRDLFLSTDTWEEADFDGQDLRWEQFGGLCTINLETCSFELPTQPQANWLFSQFISYREANEVIFNITFRFTRCRDMGNCNNDYVTLYRYDTGGVVSDRSDRNDYVPLLGTVLESRLQQLPAPTTIVRMNYRLLRPDAAAAGFYLGILDDGTCGTVDRIIVYYRVVRGRTQALLTCPDVPLPPEGSSSTSQKPCVCHANASPTSATLNRICDVNSVCNEDQACACSPGFELDSGMCRACPEGQFKAEISNATCQVCPTNSESRGEGNAICSCIPPNIRNPERPQDPCTTPPSSPRLLLTGNGVPQVRQSSITVCWLPALDTGGLDDLRYNIYLYDTTDPDSEFNKLNDEGVVQEEGGDNQTSICYELEDIDTQTSYGIIVVAANGVTGDPLLLSDLDQVQGRSVVFFLTLGEDLVPDGGSSSNVAVAVVVTLLVTLIVTAIVTALVVIVVIKFCFNKTPSTSSGQSDKVKYHTDYDSKVEFPNTAPPARKPPGPPPQPHSRKPPPPRPPHKPAYT